MKIFLSWSGSRSKQVANALRSWIPLLLHYAEPWLSDKDIEAGDRWSAEVGKELEASNFGVICLTRENLNADWILFEAGALSKALSAGSVCPYLFDVDFRDITGPLSQFQAKKAERNQTLELVEAINSKSVKPIDMPRLRELFEVLWIKLEEQLHQIPPVDGSKPAARTPTDVLEELVQVVRGFDSRLSAYEQTVGRGLWRDSGPLLSSTPGNTIVMLELEVNTPRNARGKRFIMDCQPSTVLKRIANLTGLTIDSFGTKWYLRDVENNDFIENEEYFNRPRSQVVLTDIPF
jgi:hypothetical protein